MANTTQDGHLKAWEDTSKVTWAINMVAKVEDMVPQPLMDSSNNSHLNTSQQVMDMDIRARTRVKVTIRRDSQANLVSSSKVVKVVRLVKVNMVHHPRTVPTASTTAMINMVGSGPRRS